jgi:hypothetical protein
MPKDKIIVIETKARERYDEMVNRPLIKRGIKSGVHFESEGDFVHAYAIGYWEAALRLRDMVLTLPDGANVKDEVVRHVDKLTTQREENVWFARERVRGRIAIGEYKC